MVFHSRAIRKGVSPKLIEMERRHVGALPWGINSPQFPGLLCKKYLQSMRHRETRLAHGPVPCAAILVYCSVKRLDTILLCHRIRKYPDSPVHTFFDSLRIYFFPLWKSDWKISGFAVEFARCAWTEAVPGKKSWGLKNIRIRVDGASMSSLFLVY